MGMLVDVQIMQAIAICNCVVGATIEKTMKTGPAPCLALIASTDRVCKRTGIKNKFTAEDAMLLQRLRSDRV